MSGPDLTAAELHALLALRAEVFVVEQACAYLDPDGRDLEPTTRHLWLGGADGEVLSALRVVDDGGARRIGRVVTAPAARGAGLAARLLEAALDEIGEGVPVVLAAQSHLVEWYVRFGFAVDGPEHLEDGIPHTPMRRGGEAPVRG